MKFLLILLYFIPLQFTSVMAQADVCVIAMSGDLVLFRNMPNKVVIGNNIGIKNFSISSESLNITKIDSLPNTYFLKMQNNRSSGEIYFIDNITLDTFSIQKFLVKPLPSVNLYWGGATDGGQVINRSAKTISLAFGEDVPLQGSYECTSWVLSISGVKETFQGQGSMLSAEALQSLSNAKAGSTANFSCVYSGTGVRNRQSSASIKLN